MTAAARATGAPGTAWIRRPVERPAARVRLLCLPCAGGGASLYYEWGRRLSKEVEVLAAQLPGREARLHEPPVTDLGELKSAVADALEPFLDRPLAIFGHSLGALVGLELVRTLERRGGEVLHLYAAGSRPPHTRRTRNHLLPDEEFVAVLRKLGGVHPHLLGNDEFLRLVLPAVRADFALAETYVDRHGVPVLCPITAIGGSEDEEVALNDLEGWARYTRAGFRLEILQGGHFFVSSARDEVLGVVSRTLGRDHAA